MSTAPGPLRVAPPADKAPSGQVPSDATGAPVVAATASVTDAPTPPLVAMRGISKRFGRTVANDEVDLDLAGGEIVALVGENGAGKTTLMKILYGLMRPDEGTLIVRGTPCSFASPSAAISAGLGMVHQHFMLFPSLTVVDNVVYGAEPTGRFGRYDRAAARRRVCALADEHGLAITPDARVSDLPVGVCQRIEILKLLYRAADVLILDEPTAVLTPPERIGLFAVLRRLAEAGKAIVLITHKLDEVMSATDRVVVMRDGRVVTRVATRDTTPSKLARAMVGRKLAEAALGSIDTGTDKAAGRAAPAKQAITTDPAAKPGLLIKGLRVTRADAPDRPRAGPAAAAVDGVDLTVQAGEIVAIAGVAGNGQAAFAAAIMGLMPIQHGTITLAGHDITHADVLTRRRAGLAYVPEDRHSAGLAQSASVSDNLIMGHHRANAYRGWLRRTALARYCRQLIERFGVKLAELHQPAHQLSGGNQQKLVLARELAQGASILLAEQPTRGVDVAAAAAIHEILRDYRDAGHGILLISAELSEILALADRIVVMYEGGIIGHLARAEATQELLGLLMAGQTDARQA